MADQPNGLPPNPLDDLSSRLDAARKAHAPDAENGERSQVIGRGFRLGSELLAAMIVGPLLGLGVDRLAGTSPWGLIGGILIGFAAGVRNVARAMKTEPSDEDGRD